MASRAITASSTIGSNARNRVIDRGLHDAFAIERVNRVCLAVMFDKSDTSHEISVVAKIALRVWCCLSVI
jgi:hypothetical protein